MKFYDFLMDPQLGNLAAPSFRTWHIVARLQDGDAHLLDADELAVARLITGRSRFPAKPVKRSTISKGRRGGGTTYEARRAVYFAARDYRDKLAPGEQAVIACLACDRQQAGVLFNYARATILESPLLSQQVVRETADTIEFAHGNVLEIYASSFRSIRGRTFAAVLIDEAAFLRSDESANPDVEIRRAVLPGLATLNGSFEVFSSPYMRRGLLFDDFRRHFANDDSDALFIQGETRLFNPTIDEGIVAQAYEDDPEAARSEWGALFRADLSAAFDPSWIDRATDSGVHERAPVVFLKEGRSPQYVAFTDPAGGAGRDSWATRVVHAEGDAIIDDALLEIRPPFSTGEAAKQVADFLKRYRLTSVTGDRYAGRWPADALATHGIAYVESELTKSDLYLEAVPLFSAGRVRLLDHARTLTQLRMLERRTRSGGRDSIDHPPGGNDDLSNSVCGALWLASRALTADFCEPILRPDYVTFLSEFPKQGYHRD